MKPTSKPPRRPSSEQQRPRSGVARRSAPPVRSEQVASVDHSIRGGNERSNRALRSPESPISPVHRRASNAAARSPLSQRGMPNVSSPKSNPKRAGQICCPSDRRGDEGQRRTHLPWRGFTRRRRTMPPPPSPRVASMPPLDWTSRDRGEVCWNGATSCYKALRRLRRRSRTPRRTSSRAPSRCSTRRPTSARSVRPGPSPSAPSTSKINWRTTGKRCRGQRMKWARLVRPWQWTRTTPTCATSSARPNATGTPPTRRTRPWRTAAAADEGARPATRPRQPVSTAASSSTPWPRSWIASTTCRRGTSSRGETGRGRRRCHGFGRSSSDSGSRWRRRTITRELRAGP